MEAEAAAIVVDISASHESRRACEIPSRNTADPRRPVPRHLLWQWRWRRFITSFGPTGSEAAVHVGYLDRLEAEAATEAPYDPVAL